MDDTTYQPPFIEGRRRRSPKKRIIISSLIVFVIILLGIGSMQFLGSQGQAPQVSPTPTPTVVAFPTDTPTPTQEATPTAALKVTPTKTAAKSADQETGLNRSALSVSVQNGSGKAGAGSGASELLKTLGYKVVSVGNADNFEYEDVTISVRSDKAAYLPLLKKDLGTEYTVGTTNSTLGASGSATADAVVIIGK